MIAFKGLDHVAIVVPDTQAALKVWRDAMSLPVLFTQTVQGGAIRLTHLDLGNTHLQLVEPLRADHPLSAGLRDEGARLHHLCLTVGDVGRSFDALLRSPLPPGEPAPHEGAQGKRALFLDRGATGGVQVELTGR